MRSVCLYDGVTMSEVNLCSVAGEDLMDAIPSGFSFSIFFCAIVFVIHSRAGYQPQILAPLQKVDAHAQDIVSFHNSLYIYNSLWSGNVCLVNLCQEEDLPTLCFNP